MLLLGGSTGDLGFKAAYSYFGTNAADEHDEAHFESTGSVSSSQVSQSATLMPASPSSTASTPAIDELLASAAGVVTIIDIVAAQKVAKNADAPDYENKVQQAKFRAHNQPLAALAWNPSGNLVRCMSQGMHTRARTYA